MARMSPFSSPLLLGFDRLEEVVDRLTRSSTEGYPPYNVLQVADDRLRISLAVAGFDEDGLDVTIERNELHIRGRQAEDNGAVYLYRGIAARQFPSHVRACRRESRSTARTSIAGCFTSTLPAPPGPRS